MTIAPLGLDIDSSAAVEAVQEIRLLIPAAKDAERAVSTFATGVAQGLGRVRTSAEQIGAATVGVQQQIDAIFGGSGANARDRAADVAAYGAELDELRAKFNPLFAKQQQYEANLEEIARAERLGAISAEEAAQARLREAAAMRAAGVAIATSDTAFARLTGTLSGSRMAIQNTAFQLQDLVVQMQAGVPASRALAQQLPQMLGGFGAVGAVVGVLAGVGLPAAAMALGSLGDSAGDAEENLERLRDALSGLEDVADLQGQTIIELGEIYAGTTEQILGMVAAMGKVAQLEANQAVVELLAGTFRQFAEEARAAGPAAEAMLDGLAPGVRAAVDELGLGIPVAREFADSIRALGDADGYPAQLDALSRVRDLLGANADATGVNAAEVQRLLGELLEVEEVVRRTAAASGDVEGPLHDARLAAEGLAPPIVLAEQALGGAAASAASLENAVLGAVAAAVQFHQQWGAGAQQALASVRDSWERLATAQAEMSAPGATGALGDFTVPSGRPTSAADFPLQAPRPLGDFDLFGYTATGSAQGGSGRPAGGGGRGGRSEASGEADKQAEAIRRVIEGLKFEAEAEGMTATARRIANETRRAGVDIYSEEGQQIALWVEQAVAAREATERLEEAQRYAADTASGLFTDAITGAGSFKDAIGGVIDELGRMAVTRGFETLLAGGGFGEGVFGDVLEGLFGIGAPRGAGRAGGGAVSRGVAHMVGERGPEWFVPKTSGTIVPNGGGGVTVNQVLNIGAGADRTAVAQGFAALNSEVAALKQSFRDNAVSAVRRPRYRASV